MTAQQIQTIGNALAADLVAWGTAAIGLALVAAGAVVSLPLRTDDAASESCVDPMESHAAASAPRRVRTRDGAEEGAWRSCSSRMEAGCLAQSRRRSTAPV